MPSRRARSSALGGHAGSNVMRGLDVAQHLAKLSANVLMPQMSQGPGRRGRRARLRSDGEGGLRPRSAARGDGQARAAGSRSRSGCRGRETGGRKDKRSAAAAAFMNKLGGGLSVLGTIAAGGRPSTDQMADIAIFAFDSAVDNMADDATTHHPAPKRAKICSATIDFTQYRDAAPVRADAAAMGGGKQITAQAASDRAARALYRCGECRGLYRRCKPGHAARRSEADAARRRAADRRSRLHAVRRGGILRHERQRQAVGSRAAYARRKARSRRGRSIRGSSTSISRATTIARRKR